MSYPKLLNDGIYAVLRDEVKAEARRLVAANIDKIQGEITNQVAERLVDVFDGRVDEAGGMDSYISGLMRMHITKIEEFIGEGSGE